MSADVAYLDSSAFVKLVVPEPESAALRSYLARWPRLASAALVRTEAIRAVLSRGPRVVAQASGRMQSLELIRLDNDVLDAAGRLQPLALRSLDAIHLAAAMTLAEDLAVLVTYDHRMAAAAADLGLAITAPA